MTNEGPEPAGMDRETFTISIDGQDYEVDRPVVTGAEIEELAGISPDDGLVRVQDDGTQVRVGEGEQVDLRQGDRFRKPPRFNRGQA